MKKKEEKLEAIKRSVNEMNCLLHQWKSVKKKYILKLWIESSFK